MYVKIKLNGEFKMIELYTNVLDFTKPYAFDGTE